MAAAIFRTALLAAPSPGPTLTRPNATATAAAAARPNPTHPDEGYTRSPPRSDLVFRIADSGRPTAASAEYVATRRSHSSGRLSPGTMADLYKHPRSTGP